MMMLRSVALSLIFAFSATQTVDAQPSQALAPWVSDPRFPAIHDMYWRARYLSVNAGNRLCALKEGKFYDDPRSPFRPLDQRLKAVGNRIEIIWPKALNVVVRPYQMPPPQDLCDDERATWDALFATETAIVAAERLLDNYRRTSDN